MTLKELREGKKISGLLVGEYEGLRISVHPLKAKKFGKNRVWIQIRQTGSKRWRMSASLSYARSADIQFTDE